MGRWLFLSHKRYLFTKQKKWWLSNQFLFRGCFQPSSVFPAWNPASVWEEKAASQDRILQGCFDILIPPFVSFVNTWSLLLRSPQKIHAVVVPTKPCLCTHHIRWDIFPKLLKRRWKTIIVFRVARLCENGICQSHHVLDELIKLSDADPNNLELFGISNVTTMDDGSCLDRILRIRIYNFFPFKRVKWAEAKACLIVFEQAGCTKSVRCTEQNLSWASKCWKSQKAVFIFKAIHSLGILGAANRSKWRTPSIFELEKKVPRLEVLPDVRLSSKVISTVCTLGFSQLNPLRCCDKKVENHQFLGETYYRWSCNLVVTDR